LQREHLPLAAFPGQGVPSIPRFGDDRGHGL
jgi:hypothetical protein